MTEQLYRIERRERRSGCNETQLHGADGEKFVLVPVPEVRDLGWACGEMVRNPMREYRCDECEAKNRWNPDEGCFEYQWPSDDEWCQYGFTDDEAISTSWHAVEAVETPAPGTLAWAKATVAAGGAVWWNGYPCEKYDAYGLLLPGGRRSRDTYMLVAASGWHPWGDREWLAALPDGTRVRNDNWGEPGLCEKRGYRLLRVLCDGTVDDGTSIGMVADGGWDLDREQEKKVDNDTQCRCMNWARAEHTPFHTQHHPGCEHRNVEQEAADIINGLLKAMEWWGKQEDGIPEDCWEAYRIGRCSVGRPPYHGHDEQEQDSARDVAELRDQPVPDAFEWRNAANRWREQLADLERRVKELEGKA